MFHRTILNAGFVAVFAMMYFSTNMGFGATVAYWRFDNDGKTAGQTAGTVLDETANNNDGSGVNTPTYSSSVFGTPVPNTGAPNTLSMDFERANSERILVPDSSSLDFGDTSFTLEAFVNFETAPGGNDSSTRQYVFLKKGPAAAPDTQSDYGLVFASGGEFGAANAGELVFQQGNGGSVNFVKSGLTLTDTTEWHYVSAAFDAANNEVRFIIDDQTSTVANTFAASANNLSLMIGAHVNAGATFTTFDGLIDEARISSGVVPLDELLNAAATATAPEPSACLLVVIAVAGLCLPRRRKRFA